MKDFTVFTYAVRNTLTDAEGVQDTLSWLKRQNRRIRSIKESESGALKFVGNKKKFQVPGQIEMFGGGL